MVRWWGMVILQRVELWVLLVLGLGLSWWALKPTDEGGAGTWLVATAEEKAAVEPQLVLRGAQIERDYGNARLDLDVAVHNEGIHPLRLSTPKLRLMAGEREVPAFFLPADRPPEVAAGSRVEVKLRFWLEAKDLQGELMLDLEGVKTRVKTADPYALDKLENGVVQVLRGEKW